MTIVKQSQLNNKQAISSASSASSSTASFTFESSRKVNPQGNANPSTPILNNTNVSLVSSEQHIGNNSRKTSTASSLSNNNNNNNNNNSSVNLKSNHLNLKSNRGQPKRCLLCYKLLRNAHGNTVSRGHSLTANKHLNSRNVNLVNQLQSNQLLSSNTSIRLRELLSESNNGLLLMNYLENGNSHSCDNCYTHLKQIDYHMSELDKLRNLFETKMNKTCKVMRIANVNANHKRDLIRKVIVSNRLRKTIKTNRHNTMNGYVKKARRRTTGSIDLINKKKDIERLKLLGNPQKNDQQNDQQNDHQQHHHQHQYQQQSLRQHDETESHKIKKQKLDDCATNQQELGFEDQQPNENETNHSELPFLSKEQWAEFFQKNPDIAKNLPNPLLSNDSTKTLFALIAAVGLAAASNPIHKPIDSNVVNDADYGLLNSHLNGLNGHVYNNPNIIENLQPSRSKRKPANPSRLFKNENGNNPQESGEGVDLNDKQVDNFNTASVQSEKENKRNLNGNINSNGIKRNNNSQDLTIQQLTKAKGEKLHISPRNDNRFVSDSHLQAKSNRNDHLNRHSNQLNKENESCTDVDELGGEHDELEQIEDHMDNEEDESDYGAYGNSNRINAEMVMSPEYDEDEQDNEDDEVGNEDHEHAYDEDEYDDEENPSAHEPTTEDDEHTGSQKAYQTFRVNQQAFNKHPKNSSFNHKQARNNKNGLKLSNIISNINSEEENENEGFDDFDDTNPINNHSFRKGSKVFANHKTNGSSSPSSSSTKHPCTLCKKTFKTQNILRQHMRIHTGDKPFVCEICHKAFSQMASLKYHSATHSDDRPYKCSNCPKTFKLKPPYKKHVKECLPKSNNQVSSTSSSFNYSSIKV